MRSLMTEIKKTKGRFVWVMLPAALLFEFAWIFWALGKMDAQDLAQGYYMLLLDLPLVNTIIVPLILAVVASRLCDTENKGNTYKLLCTLEEKGTLFRDKFLLGSLYVLGFVLLQLALIAFFGFYYSMTQEIPWREIGYFFVSTLVVSLVILLLQIILSLMMDNQLYPLFIGLIGTFIGLFSWFFPNLPLRYLVPWGYYCVGCTINYNYYEETRIMECYTIPFSFAGFAVLILFGILLYAYGRFLFVKKEV